METDRLVPLMVDFLVSFLMVEHNDAIVLCVIYVVVSNMVLQYHSIDD